MAGRLQVCTYNETVALPISNANVIIRGENTEISLFTDISGQTESIELASPPFEYSQQPNLPKPYAEYNAEISADGFEKVIIEGIQIFPDTLAIQNVYMTPLDFPDEPAEEINIQAPRLWGDYPENIIEDEVKPINEETGFVVLDEVVVPEYIVVHDGLPNDDSAPNYYVPFKDYIKNVASSEIYSTWPDAAIRANVLAIISFTLNRVYTEWYRNMGKNFTITSSTAYDHFFVYGRNIFEEISVVVDEMFTTYIKRAGSRQPLFAQYCDGVRVQCPNLLSQWGCKYLADEGYSALDILRYYYGSNIYLDQAGIVIGIPVSYKGEVLSIGSSGSDVRTIQSQLNSISNNYPLINKLRVDGIYGEATAESVRTFQKIFDLPQTGSVDFSTWYQISSIYVAVDKIAEL